jgi:hypothetical protein
MKTNHFLLVEKRQNTSAFSGIGIQPTTMILNQQQLKFQPAKTAILHAQVQNNALSTSAGTPVQSSKENSRQPTENRQKTEIKRQMKTEDNRTRTKWQLLNLVLFLVIILWLNNTGLWKSPTSYISSNKSSIGNRSTAFPVIAIYI